VDENPDARFDARVVLRALLVCSLGFAWAAFFWFTPARQWPVYGDVYRISEELIADFAPIHRTLRWAIKSWIFVLIPVLALWLAGRPPKALGLGKMATHGWRIVALGFGISLPILIWIGLQPDIHRYYGHAFRSPVPVLAGNALVIAVEHVFIEGLVLALALPSGGLHNRPEAPRHGRLAWLGFGNTEGNTGFSDWIGIPRGAWPALIGQAILFGVVHAGKASAELWSAFPGGLGLGLLTYRIRSVWPSVLLHAGTGAIILITAYLSR
jgi:hypothetical protein